MRSGLENSKCHFCQGAIAISDSHLDQADEVPDIYAVNCKNPKCGLHYHCDGTLLVTQPDLSQRTDFIREIREANNSRSAVICLFTWSNSVISRSYQNPS